MDIEGLLKSLNDHSARYVVIGAQAFPVHGWGRTTLDIDILIEPTRENAQRFHAALAAFGYDLTDVSVEDLLRFKLLVRQYVVACDIHPFVKGANFERVWSRSVVARYGRTEARFASLDDLIEMKEAAGRPRDLEDLKVLRELRRNPDTKPGSDP